MKTTLCQCGLLKDKRAKLCRTCKDAEPIEKTCNGCNKAYPIKQFSLRPNGRGGHKRRSRCKQCEAKYGKWRRKNMPERVRATKLAYAGRNPDKVKRWALRARWRRLGFNPDEVEAFVAAHKGQCDICGIKPDVRALAIDHCHKTGRLRGLLCSNCNTGIGMFKDKPELLRRAAEYLDRPSLALRC